MAAVSIADATAGHNWQAIMSGLMRDPRGFMGGIIRKRDSTFKGAKDKLAVIEADTKNGSGFLMRIGDRNYLVTNAHVVRGSRRVSATLMDGRVLRLGRAEWAVGRDFVRWEVDRLLPSFPLEVRVPDIGELITVLGNSDGKGVVTELHGRIVGVGPREIEVDANFVLGNSGSPVINRAGRIVGVASYLRDCRNSGDWTKDHTRFNGVRRFALRLNGLRWVAK